MNKVTEFLSTILRHSQLLIIVLSILIVVSSIVTIYYVTKIAVYNGIKRAIDEYPIFRLISELDTEEIESEYVELKDRIKKSHIILSKFYKSRGNL